jgi:hypothetical protein
MGLFFPVRKEASVVQVQGLISKTQPVCLAIAIWAIAQILVTSYSKWAELDYALQYRPEDRIWFLPWATATSQLQL